MEILRRSLLIGCLLPGLWLQRLAFLEPVVTIAPANGTRETEVPRRTGPEWQAMLADLDSLSKGQVPARAAGRVNFLPPAAGESNFQLFVPAGDVALGPALWDLRSAGSTSFASSPAGGAVRYRVDYHAFTNRDFRLGEGFTGQPRPPPSLLYPLRLLGVALLLVGTMLFVLLQGPVGERRSLTTKEGLWLAGLVFLFAGPLLAVGGSVQALTRAAWLTVPCWLLAGGCMHLFVRPAENLRLRLSLVARDGSSPGPGDAAGQGFFRIGAAFLAMALGPVATIIAASMFLWSR